MSIGYVYNIIELGGDNMYLIIILGIIFGIILNRNIYRLEILCY